MGTITDDYAKELLTDYHALPTQIQSNRAAAVTNKLDPFLSHPVLRAALGAPGAPDFPEIMDTPGHITLVSLGADRNPQAQLVGRMLVAACQRAALSRVDVDITARNPVRLLVDEAQLLLGDDACEILAECRKYRLSLFVGTQFAGRFSPELRASVSVNCTLQLQFTTSSAEASVFAAEVVSSLSREEVRQTILAAPVGCAVVIRRGQPAAYVRTPDSPDPEVDETTVAAVRQAAIDRTTVPITELTRLRQEALASQPEVIHHGRKPSRRGTKA